MGPSHVNRDISSPQDGIAVIMLHLSCNSLISISATTSCARVSPNHVSQQRFQFCATPHSSLGLTLQAIPAPEQAQRTFMAAMSDSGLKPTVVYHNLNPSELYEKARSAAQWLVLHLSVWSLR